LEAYDRIGLDSKSSWLAALELLEDILMASGTMAELSTLSSNDRGRETFRVDVRLFSRSSNCAIRSACACCLRVKFKPRPRASVCL